MVGFEPIVQGSNPCPGAKWFHKLLAIWGKDDPSFIWAGAEAFRKDLPDAKIIPVDSGHFTLENCCGKIAEEIKKFF